MGKSLRLEVGSCNNLPHCALIGQMSDFYLWVDDGGSNWSSSQWIKGRKANKMFHELKKLIEKDKKEFCEKLRQYHAQYSK